MPENGFRVSDSALRSRNRGAYSSPYSGVGEEFFPLGVLPDHAGFTLHEAGHDPQNHSWDFPSVLSPFWRLYFNTQPGHRVVFGDRSIELAPDRLVLIPDRQLFHCQGSSPVPHTWLAFSVARRPSPRQAMPILLPPADTEIELLTDLSRLFVAEDRGTARNRIFHISMALLHVVLCRPEISWHERVPSMVVRTVQYIEQHYASGLYIPRLAEMVDLCTEALARSFKRYQGETIGQFIVKVRVRRAADLLAQTDSSIDEVAEKTGFPNRFYLSRVFKKITGQSPAEFRHRHSADAPRSDTIAWRLPS
jgi:AraC family transcriptional regulator, arabinose operon regulatory protein